MTNNCWVLTKDLILSYKLRKKADIRDTFILIFISLLTGLLSIGGIVIGSQNGILIGNYLIEYNTIPNLYIIIPLFAVFFLLLIIFFILRYKESGVLPNKKIITIGLILLVLNIVGIFCFSPSGNFTYISPIENSTYNTTITLSYNGLTLKGKILETIAILLLDLFFILAFTYIKTLSNYVMPLFRLALFVPIIIAFVLLIYSFATEGWKWDNNLRYLMKKVVEIANIQSLTTHKNMFGFFLFLATLSSLIFFSKHHNLFFYLLSILFLTCTVLILSKTSIVLIALVFVFSSFIYFFINRKKHKINSLICLIVNIALLLIIAVLSIFLIKNGFLEKFKNHNTLDYRFGHLDIAIAMFKNQPITRLIFGYGRIPFTKLYKDFETAIDYEVLWTSHNCYMETIAHYGLVGLLKIFICDFYVLYCISYLVFKKKEKECAIYYPIFLILCIYSFFEPRMLFLLSSGPEVFLFYFIILFPVLLDYGHSKTNEVLV